MTDHLFWKATILGGLYRGVPLYQNVWNLCILVAYVILLENLFLQVFRFCRSKCHKAFKKKRNPRQVRWTKAFRKSAGKELTVDPSLEFEKRRHVPIKYKRETWSKTGSLDPVMIL